MQPLTQLSEEERMFQSSVREFSRTEIAPHVRDMDARSAFPAGPSRQAFDLGLMGIEIPEEYGGQGGTFFQSVLAVEEIAAVDPAAAVIVDVQNTLVINAIMRWGTDEQKREYLPASGQGHRRGICAIGSGSGSDAFALQTRATASDGHIHDSHGRKLWITNAAEAGIFLVFANARSGRGL